MKGGIKLSWIALAAFGLAHAQLTGGQALLRGSGSTLAAPLMRVWTEEFHKYRVRTVAAQGTGSGPSDPLTSRSVSYEAVGSSAGLERLKAGQRDFAVSERPMTSAELRKARLRQVPVAVSGIAVAVNLPGTPKLILSGPVLADIYLGKVHHWNDTSIAQLNPGVRLPVQPIKPIYRADGSGSTYALSSYLSAVSPAWKSKLGRNTKLEWPVGTGAQGSEGVRDMVTMTAYSIGYLSDVQARRARMNTVSLINAAGRAVPPTIPTLNAAAAHAKWQPSTDFVESLVNTSGANSYPITTAIYFLYPDKSKATAHRRSVAFAQWTLKKGRMTLRKLGYLPLPLPKAELVGTYLNR